MNKTAKRRVVVVLGMPRSGTSLLANVINVLGVSLGHNLIQANDNNPEGYWENADLSQLQQQILDGPDVFDVPAYSLLPVPAQSEPSPAFRRAKEQLIELVLRELSQAPGLWGFKDARTTRLLPIWKEVFNELELEPVYLLSLRHPLAVAASMAKLWETSPGLAQSMWITHNLDVLTSTRKQPAPIVVDYDRWFTHPREQLAVLVAALRLPSSAVDSQTVAAALARVKPDLRHNRGNLSACLPWLAETYTLLQAAAITGKISPRVWSIERHVRRARVFIHHSLAGSKDPVVSQAAQEREAKIQELDKLCCERAAAIAELSRLCRERDATIADLDAQCSERAATVADLSRLCRERDATIANLDRLCRERGDTVAGLDRLCRERDETIARQNRWRSERNAAHAAQVPALLTGTPAPDAEQHTMRVPPSRP